MVADAAGVGSSQVTRWFWAGVALAVVAATLVSLWVVFVVSPGGAPQSPSHGAWVDQAHTSLEEVASDLSTAQLLLRLAEDDKVMSNYQQIVALDSENAAGKVADHLGGEQPELADQATYKLVTTTLSDASDLLSSLRIAVVRGNASQYPGLEHALTKMQGELSKAEAKVTAS
jgi:hypothetical protein